MLCVRRLFVLVALVFAPPTLAQQQPNWAAAPGTPLSAWALQPTQADPRHPPRSVRVARGQSLYDIATLYQIPVLALIEANGLEPPYAAAPGSVLRLPAPNIHVVGEGERFEDIAHAYNVDLHSLATLNRMRPPYAVAPGDRIVLPAGARSDDESGAPSALASANTEPPVAAQTVHAGARFAWPIRGPIVARYGVQANGARLDGVEIAG